MDSKSILPKPDDISSSCIGKKGNSSRLLIVIIVPVVGTVIIFGFLYRCWLNRKARKIRTGISFTLGELINSFIPISRTFGEFESIVLLVYDDCWVLWEKKLLVLFFLLNLFFHECTLCIELNSGCVAKKKEAKVTPRQVLLGKTVRAWTRPWIHYSLI